ncbi:helix-turn-helix domain-containing protein [Vagococcus fluvialis]|uniref:Helix-turn-helix transcriptional regulator n=1 Tax=Vagococcus fluvialis TaxID=2738 RepID=A0A7X6D6J2_9ENTE|nr:helix-turn-helix transcriptional regulator [Vagococcus fluvialis]NKC66712.1 helix-turn-helix transcriptional regulator [Vagococcus fluvialis]
MNRIKELRTEAKLTQYELGQIIGVSDASINKYEKDLMTPKIDKLEKMAEVFHVSVDYLTGRTDSRVGIPGHWDDLAKKMNIGPNLNLKSNKNNENSSEELELILHFRKLNDSGKNEALKQVENLSKITDYTN